MPRRILITAGPTREPIDDVRYIANRSSGRMGIALAEAARDADWSVRLLYGPGEFACPCGIDVERFESAVDLERLLAERFPLCDVLVMAAAVADYRPMRSGVAKLPRKGEKLILELEPTPDLVARCAATKRPDQRIIGFALEEPAILRRHAREKLARKRLDAIVANPLVTMGAEEIEACIIAAVSDAERDGILETGFPRIMKREFAARLIEWIDRRWPA